MGEKKINPVPVSDWYLCNDTQSPWYGYKAMDFSDGDTIYSDPPADSPLWEKFNTKPRKISKHEHT